MTAGTTQSSYGSNGDVTGGLFLLLIFLFSLFVPAIIIGIGFGQKFRQSALLGALTSTVLFSLVMILHYQYHIL